MGINQEVFAKFKSVINGKGALLAGSVRKNKLDGQMCGISCNFISEKRGGWSRESLLITTNPIRGKSGSVLSIPQPPLSAELKSQEIKSRISSFSPFPPPIPVPRPRLSHPPAIYPPSSANSMWRTDELGVMEQAQIKRNASKCNTAVGYFRKQSFIGSTKRSG